MIITIATLKKRSKMKVKNAINNQAIDLACVLRISMRIAYTYIYEKLGVCDLCILMKIAQFPYRATTPNCPINYVYSRHYSLMTPLRCTNFDDAVSSNKYNQPLCIDLILLTILRFYTPVYIYMYVRASNAFFSMECVPHVNSNRSIFKYVAQISG